MIIMACPPVSWATDAVFLTSFMLWYFVINLKTARRELTSIMSVALAASAIGISAHEFPHRNLPKIRGDTSDHLVVIGDSISAGLDTSISTWPTMMERNTGLPIRNLAKPGAMMADGITMAREVSPQDGLIVLEIGGNDLLANQSAANFDKSLDTLLSRLAAPDRTIVMFELPLLPHKICYGQVQRRLASQYGVWLIPKRYFVQIIRGADATSDGLHLTSAGAHRMALLVTHVLSPVLKMNNSRFTSQVFFFTFL
jgi:lysophospholipase L1-like esterase